VQIEGLEADVNRYTILAKADAIQGVQLEKAVLGLKSAESAESYFGRTNK
jgi:membrane fusion protein (multidrug efflux system)